jgi:spermidine synthase
LIQRITTQVEDAGKVAGNVYAVSTLGGIVTTFVMGFLVIPELGISRPILAVGLLIALLANLLLKVKKLPLRLALSLALALPAALIVLRSSAESDEISIVYEEEGILGQLKVVDTWDQEHEVKARKMLINGIPQTNVVKGDIESRSFFNYVHMISSLAAMKPSGSEVLICGLGGGSLVVEFEKLGFHVDAVDIDGRQLELAQRYFYLDAGGLKFYTDDARHFISESKKHYDIIVLDLLVAEVQPDHLFSLEAFEVIHEKLKPDGLLLLNFQGYFRGPKGVAARSIFYTLQQAGFETHAVPGSEGAVGDLIFVASPTRVPFEDVDPRRLNSCCVEISQTDVFARDPRKYVVSDPDLSDAWLLRDDRPVLDMLRLGTILEFRRNKIKSITNKELDGDMRLFK